MTSMLDHALALVEKGYHVFPLRPGTKDPFAQSHGFKDATTDAAVITQWWTLEPNANIGIACAASNLLVLDIDPRNRGVEGLKRFERDHGDLPDTSIVRTGGGGVHLFYILPEGFKARGKLDKDNYPGCDIKVNGYVVAPPSLHPNGTRYEWASEAPIAPLPPSLVEHAAKSTEPIHLPDLDVREPASLEVLQRAREHVMGLGPAVEGDGGDAHTYRVCATLLDGWRLTIEEALPILRDWNRGCVPPWDEQDLLTKMRNAIEYAEDTGGEHRWTYKIEKALTGSATNGSVETSLPGMGTPAAGSPGESDASLVTSSGDSFSSSGGPSGPGNVAGQIVEKPDVSPASFDFGAQVVQAYHDLQTLKSGGGRDVNDSIAPMFEKASSLFDRVFPKTNWLIQGLVKSDGVGVSAGEPKTTKTWNVLECAMAIATGTSAFGEFNTVQKGPVCIFLAEDSEKATRNRLRALAKFRKMDARKATNNIYFTCRKFVDITDDRQVALMIASVRHVGAKLLCLDPLRDLHTGDENDNTAMSEVIQNLRRIRELTGAAVMFVHHASKLSGDSAKRSPGQRMRGASAIHGKVDFGMYMVGLETDYENHWTGSAVVEIRDGKGAGVFDLDLSLTDDEHGEAVGADWRVTRGGKAPDPVDDKKFEKEIDRVLDALVRLGSTNVTMKQLRDETRMGWPKLTRVVSHLERQHIARNVPRRGITLDETMSTARAAELATRTP